MLLEFLHKMKSYMTEATYQYVYIGKVFFNVD